MNQPPMAQPGPRASGPRSRSAFFAWRNCQMMNTTIVAMNRRMSRPRDPLTALSALSMSLVLKSPLTTEARLNAVAIATSEVTATSASRTVNAVASPRSEYGCVVAGAGIPVGAYDWYWDEGYGAP